MDGLYQTTNKKNKKNKVLAIVLTVTVAEHESEISKSCLIEMGTERLKRYWTRQINKTKQNKKTPLKKNP